MIEFEVGDRVNVMPDHDAVGTSSEPLPSGPATVDSVDDSDSDYHLAVIFDGDVGNSYWIPCGADFFTPLKAVSTPPVFTSVEEANAWLEANA